MDEKFILKLLLSYERGECTEDEVHVLEEWYRDLGKPFPPRLLADSDRRLFQDKIWEGITAKVRQPLPSPPRKSRLRRLRGALLSVAALFVFVISFIGYRWRLSPTEPVYVLVTTGQGEVKKVELPDHSVVWLNGSSSLRYPGDMHNYRRLFLDEGEAFFDVHPDHEHPFTVKTANGLQIKVLGTAFTIKAYKSIADEKVVVLRGKVMVENGGYELAVLTKGQGAAVNKKQGTKTNLRVDSAEVNGWTYGKVTLTNVSFEELSVALQNTFGTRILFLDQSLNGKRISISYNRKDSLDEILNALKTIYKISYDTDDQNKTVRIRAGG